MLSAWRWDKILSTFWIKINRSIFMCWLLPEVLLFSMNFWAASNLLLFWHETLATVFCPLSCRCHLLSLALLFWSRLMRLIFILLNLKKDCFLSWPKEQLCPQKRGQLPTPFSSCPFVSLLIFKGDPDRNYHSYLRGMSWFEEVQQMSQYFSGSFDSSDSWVSPDSYC